jgi:hypothetical protein
VATLTSLLPPDVEALAVAHRLRQQQIAAIAVRESTKLWGFVDPASVDASWARIGPRLLALIRSALAEAARGAQDYVSASVDGWGGTPDPAGTVPAYVFAQSASDGRPLDSLLRQPSFEVGAFLDQGMDAGQALAVGARHLTRIVATQVADSARISTGVAQVNDRTVHGYVRMLTPPSCSRCAVLAGKHYRFNKGFQRHPLCDCVHIPTLENLPGLATDPQQYFESLPEAEQNRVFTKAGAQAIRDGSDISRVVNARRGMYEAGGRSFTTEATTKRGINRRVRLMPEQIYREAAGNRDETLRLLRLHGYIY